MPMSIRKGGDYKPCDEGTHPAICEWCIEMGLQPPSSPKYRAQPKVYLSFVLPTTERADGAPFSLGRTYTLSLNDKAALTPAVKAMLGAVPDELESCEVLLGKTCLVTVEHRERSDGRVVADIAAVAPLPKGMEVPEVVIDPVYYDFHENDQKVYNRLPEWLRERIEKALDIPEEDEDVPPSIR